MYKFFFILFIIVVLDGVYISNSKDYYEKEMNINFSNVKMVPAVIAWLCIGVSYYYIVQEPFINKYLRALILGVGMYGVYNATNYAVFKDYSRNLAIRDTMWGLSLLTMVTFIGESIKI
jgi:uncharacterized membrane protein